MFKRIMGFFLGQIKVRYTSEQISNGLDLMALKVGRMALSVEIISPYFDDQRIDGKNFMIPQPLKIILSDVVKYHYGQLYRCYFDSQGRENRTASISVLSAQIFNNERDGKEKKIEYPSEFREIKSKLGKAQKYKGKLKQFSHKHFAHTDTSKSLEDSEKELATLGIPWHEFVSLIKDAKTILSNMCLVCQKSKPDFSESALTTFKKEFWDSIKYTEVDIVNRPNL